MPWTMRYVPGGLLAVGVFALAVHQGVGLRDLGAFLWAVGSNLSTITGGVIGGLLKIYQSKTGQTVPWKSYRWPLALCLVASALLSWHKERDKKPGVDFPHFDRVIRPDRDWKLVLQDRNNPLTITVEILDGRLFASIKNSRDEDHSADRTRRVFICPPGEGAPLTRPQQ